MTTTLLQGDCRELLPTLPERSIQTVVTSPPYFGLRDYGTATWEGGDSACEHIEMKSGMSDKNTLGPTGYLPQTNAANVGRVKRYRDICDKCGAQRLDQQIGLEATPDAYVQALVSVFRKVWRVLRDDGTLWVVIGDSYAGSWGNYSGQNRGNGSQRTITNGSAAHQKSYDGLENWRPPTSNKLEGIKSKDLIGIPWMVAFALRADGWYLRSDCIWAKPNPMPESVTDRPTKAHEYIFLLSKSERYYYDAAAIAEHRAPVQGSTYSQPDKAARAGITTNGTGATTLRHRDSETRNRRTVWTVATQPVKLAHFATFPEKLIEPCILAGSAARACEVCGAPWERVMERKSAPPEVFTNRSAPQDGMVHAGSTINGAMRGHGQKLQDWRDAHPPITTGFRPTCTCPNDGTARSIVLDPFAGSGTTLRVAERLCRDSIGIDLGYTDLQEKRTDGVQRMMVDLL